jgi:ubiquinone/menaquinone biosynthesis C-methylase UbiE
VTIHNLTDPYPIPDNSVDEILTVHVIEHISRGEVSAMIKEWRRILKPMGFVATEWPDLLKLCQFIVNDPGSIYSTNKKIQKRAVAGIYGNIDRYKDISMLHKWGYSEESMCLLYQEHGYSRTIIESPKYQKTLADGRVVAYK